MGNHNPILPAWLNRLLSSKPDPLPHVTVQPRCTCGRFCSTHDDAPDMTAKLIHDMDRAGLYVPASARSLRPASPDVRETGNG